MGRDEDLKLIPIAELTVNNISRKGKLIIFNILAKNSPTSKCNVGSE